MIGQETPHLLAGRLGLGFVGFHEAIENRFEPRLQLPVVEFDDLANRRAASIPDSMKRGT
jgi:hypothetical protein